MQHLTGLKSECMIQSKYIHKIIVLKCSDTMGGGVIWIHGVTGNITLSGKVMNAPHVNPLTKIFLKKAPP